MGNARFVSERPATSAADGRLRIIALNINNEEHARSYAADAGGIGWPEGAYESRGFVGESILVVAPGGKTMLIDAAWASGYSLPDWGEIDYGTNPVSPFLKKEGIDTIDWAVVSHQHYDHIGGIAEIVRSKVLRVKALLWSPLPDDLFRKWGGSLADDCISLTHDLADACKDHAVPVVDATQGETIDLGGGVSLEVISTASPEREVESYVNNNCVVLRLTYGDFTVMLTGDAGFWQEERIMADYQDVKADVLKLGHHAGANATGEAWLQAVAPAVGVSSMPRWLSEDERGLRVERQLTKAGVSFYRTWEHGNIEIQSDGHEFWVTTER
jgi:beta-lactamase superfamily II metal-dependent hydrolase